MAGLIFIGATMLFGGGYLIYKGIDDMNRDEEDAFVNQAEEIMESLILILNKNKELRKKLFKIAEQLHKARSNLNPNLLNLQYVEKEFLDEKNSLAFTFARKKGNNPRVYNGIMLASYRQCSKNNNVLVVEIKIVLGLNGGGSNVVMPLRNLNFTVLRDTFENFRSVRFELSAINNRDVISFYLKCGFVKTGQVVNGCVRMVYTHALR